MKSFFIYIFISIASITYAQDTTLICYQHDPEVFPLDNLNTRSIEFSPVYYQDGLVFVMAKERNQLFDPKTGQAYFDLMYTDIGPDGIATRPVSFSSNIRTQYHEGPCTFSSDGKEIFFTRSNLAGNTGINDAKGEVQLKIYHGTRGEEDWENISELPFSSNEYSIAHPSLSADGKWLVFSSNMPGGFGEMDLYVAERIDGKWQAPFNAGRNINSKGNDVFPFWHPGGYLFFSSDGREGLGGLDLFATAWTDQHMFKGIQRLVAPFSSGRDDLGLIISDDGKSGYFASDRKPTKGRDDLYAWSSENSIFCSRDYMQPELSMREILVTSEDATPLPSAYIWMIPMDQEGPSRYKELFNTELVANEDDPGSFYLKWGITDTLSILTADGISGDNGRVNVNIDLKKTYAVVVQRDGYTPFVNIIPGENLPAYIRLIKVPEEATNCFNTLFTIYNAAGTVHLEGANIHITGKCLRAPVGLMTNSEGNAATCLPAGCPAKVEIQLHGYTPQTFTFSPTEDDMLWPVYLNRSEKPSPPPSTIETGTIIVLENIYYDFNKSAIRTSDAGELNALANVLKEYPDLTIELTSHTDTRGSAEYNMELSQRRSESSKNYLMTLGVDGRRIITRAAGESMPRNRCENDVPCSEAEHQYNRRTEVRITNPASGMEVKYKSQG